MKDLIIDDAQYLLVPPVAGRSFGSRMITWYEDEAFAIPKIGPTLMEHAKHENILTPLLKELAGWHYINENSSSDTEITKFPLDAQELIEYSFADGSSDYYDRYGYYQSLFIADMEIFLMRNVMSYMDSKRKESRLVNPPITEVW